MLNKYMDKYNNINGFSGSLGKYNVLIVQIIQN